MFNIYDYNAKKVHDLILLDEDGEPYKIKSKAAFTGFKITIEDQKNTEIEGNFNYDGSVTNSEKDFSIPDVVDIKLFEKMLQPIKDELKEIKDLLLKSNQQCFQQVQQYPLVNPQLPNKVTQPQVQFQTNLTQLQNQNNQQQIQKVQNPQPLPQSLEERTTFIIQQLDKEYNVLSTFSEDEIREIIQGCNGDYAQIVETLFS